MSSICRKEVWARHLVHRIIKLEAWGEAAKYLDVSKSTFFRNVNSNKYIHPTFEYRIVRITKD